MMERLGVASAAEVDVETLAARLEAEVCAGGGVLMVPPMIGGWARKQNEVGRHEPAGTEERARDLPEASRSGNLLQR